MKHPKYFIEPSLLRIPLKSFLLFAITFFYSMACFSQSNVLAKKGVLDLSKWNWKSDGIADLNGEWEFYWNTLYNPSGPGTSLTIHPDYINVPGFWNSNVPGAGMFKPAFGFGTYRLRIFCPPVIRTLSLNF